MEYVKLYRFEVINEEAVLINGSTGISEYKIECIDTRQSLVKVSALTGDDRLCVPFGRIEIESMASIKQQFPEYFI